ncbi:MAG: hypothetical protein AVDCRST_MAG42-1289 [uncultured Chthoniobacterales bacterium]|uniref:Uncharacterized protein n=1 Tax=uncultured Chthoniobacterales bacterium TaxID=1836801 RepID=A0A6J4HWZ1_9BACT|nr:MAG: hypothetical protein AVDCRST_MAG42-1289 [uncultured Chthoniobacterales bacterium]
MRRRTAGKTPSSPTSKGPASRPQRTLNPPIVTFLPPAAYTAVVSGLNDASGVAVVEVYTLQ